MAIRKNLSEYTVAELKEKALTKGIKSKELNGKKKAEIIELIREKYSKKTQKGGKLAAPSYMAKVRKIMGMILIDINQRDNNGAVNLEMDDVEPQFERLAALEDKFGVYHKKAYNKFMKELHRNDYMIHEMRDEITKMIIAFSTIAP